MSKPIEEFIKQQMGKEIDERKLISMLKTQSLNVRDIAEKLEVPLQKVQETIQDMTERKVMFDIVDNEIIVRDAPLEGGIKYLNPEMWQGDTLKLGFVSDNHMGSHFERIDVLNLLYDLFESEGIKTVLHGGNFIEGEARFNQNEIHKRGFGRQMAYAVEKYPYKEGIETWFVSGDDHEGWYNQREGINSGEYFQMERERAGKFDLKHLGYVEADIDLNDNKYENPMWCRVMHPGGGSAYAVSYAPQKLIESFQPGEKPHILFIGHYHKMSYNNIRGVHTIQMGCTCNQSIYMRKKKIEAHVGGGIAEFRRASDGILNRCRVEFITAFDRKFYIGKDKYWKG